MKAKSVSEMIVRAAEQFAEWPCLGYRPISDGVVEDKFSWYVFIQCMLVRSRAMCYVDCA